MKRILFNYVIFAVLALLLFFGLTSCTSFTTPDTGIVTVDLGMVSMVGIDLERPFDNYYIYLDGTYQDTMIASGFLTIPDVPIGVHSFKAYNYIIAGDSVDLCDNGDTGEEVKLPENGYSHCSGMVTYEVNLGVNHVTIPVDCYPIMIIEI